jgi:hypothetical protein
MTPPQRCARRDPREGVERDQLTGTLLVLVE